MMSHESYSYEEMKALCEDLQLQVERHHKVEFDLLKARDAIYREMERFKVIQAHSEKAFLATTHQQLASLSVDFIAEAFEMDAVALFPVNDKNDWISALADVGFSNLPTQLPYKNNWFRDQDSQIFPQDSAVLESWGVLDLEEAIVSPFDNRESVRCGIVVGGRTRAKRDYYPPFEDEVRSAFSVMVRQIGLLWQSLELQTDLRRALTEVERYKNKLEAENTYLRSEVELARGFENIIGQSPPMERLRENIERVASSEATVLIQGESGTGKELIARAIHQGSPRRDAPLVKVNCAVLPANMIESELFGHEKGAFTGAHQRRIGRFELADSGTIFLDEIGEMPLDLQSKLLRVLQESELERLGGEKSLRVDVRVIAASNRDLADEVRQGRFREDLYYRLNVFPLYSPALRERKEDIPVLAMHFARRFASKHTRTVKSITHRCLIRLQEHHWPGNVRELQNTVERAVIMSEDGMLDFCALFDQAQEPVQKAQIRFREGSKSRTLHEVEIEMIKNALQECQGVIGGKKGAARLLDVPPSTLRERIQRYGIVR